MRLQYKEKGDGIPYAKKEAYEYQNVQYEADLKTGDIITILDGGVEEEGNFGLQNNFKIKTRNGEKKIAMNQATINVLVSEFGEDTETWVGKDVNVLLKKGIIGGKKAITCYLVTKGYSLDEYGELMKDENMKSVAPAANVPPTAQESVGIQAPGTAGPPPGEEVKVEEIPF